MAKQYKINNHITAPEVRLLGEDNKQIGILSKDDALEYALGQGADLVVISESAKPPVAKIIDYKKFLYQEAKKESESKKAQKATGIKELVVGGPFAAQGDINTRIRRAHEFFKDGFKVKFIIKFQRRQITHPEFGHKIMKQLIEELKEEGKIEREVKMEGKLMTMTIVPIK